MMFFDRTLYIYAMSMVGQPYIWGGDDPILGYDCSGLTIELLRSAGELPPKIDTTAHGLFEIFDRQECVVDACSFGALLFWGDIKSIHHVAFGLDARRFIGAQGGGALTKTREDAAKQNAYTRIMHLSHVATPVAIRKPTYSKIGGDAGGSKVH